MTKWRTFYGETSEVVLDKVPEGYEVLQVNHLINRVTGHDYVEVIAALPLQDSKGQED